MKRYNIYLDESKYEDQIKPEALKLGHTAASYLRFIIDNRHKIPGIKKLRPLKKKA